MLSTLVVCLLVMGATAFKPPMAGLKKGAAPSLKQEQEPCCAPNYFTYSATITQTSEDSESDLLLEMIHSEGAYDAITQEYSLRLFEEFSNKTERHLRIIENYKKEESYLIVKDGDEEYCFAGKTEGEFTKECIPEDATYIGSATVGDRSLEVESWYFASEDQSTHTAQTVEKDECVPVSMFSREFDLDTGKEVYVVNADVYDFGLGICDREYYFKPPSSCDEDRVLTEPTKKMLKFQARRRKGLIPF